MSTVNVGDSNELGAWRAAHPELFARPLAERWRNRLVFLALLAVFLFGLWWIDATPARLLYGSQRLGFLIRLMLPPSDGGALGIYINALIETLAMAFLGTALSSVIAFPLGFLAARNIVPNFAVHFAFRRVLDVLRGIDILIWALIFVAAVGMGPFAGVLAIAVSDLPFLTKLYAEAIENVDRKPIEAVQAAGANRLLGIRLAVVPQVLPVIVSNMLYFFESNVRAAAILGIVGAGGIGLQLSQEILVNNWDQACFIIIMMLVAVGVIDFISRRIRAWIMGAR
ncbi:MAG TPA: phosphonate ABC transporter, permease protein PhnE [Devosia sp.]|nr:phosphonate ABC transporter, permease protein PhnE [Devosia sp.]